MASFYLNLYSDYWGTNQLSQLPYSWYPPPPEWIKLNVDASLLSSYNADIGALEGKCVHHLMKNGQWDYSLIEKWFHPELLNAISKIHVHPDCADKVELQKICHGKTISGFAFEQVLNRRFNFMEEGYYKWLNKLKLSKKVETFWWRLSNASIPTNLYLKNRKLFDDDTCARGCDMVEDYEHISVNCKHLVDIINQLNSWGIPIPTFNSLDHCLIELKQISGKNLGVVQIYCTVVYFSWKNRNEIKHGKSALPYYVVAANALFVAITKATSYLSYWSTNLLRESSISWCPPPKDWMKINVDASLTPSGLAGIGGIFRDCFGRFILAFGRTLIHWDIAHLELDAILSVKDYVKSWMKDYKGVIIESDNLNVIKYIQNSLKQDIPSS
ncbi:uncharacterized protein LOC110106100 [Dendrobium catenatum]|uniref:uncharacterized protein LOC110106100 n=1 Tax=Dendrobium catenatum TaxID=906689 RepID=UPI0010A0B74C|nr:uncharacterized protein LOC110106100 [Dendrobium catenatum]